MPAPRKKPARVGKKPKHPGMLVLRLDDETVAALQSFIAAQKVPPERTTVVLTALREFLTENGYPPKS